MSASGPDRRAGSPAGKPGSVRTESQGDVDNEEAVLERERDVEEGQTETIE